jgi:hypothetical protein
MLLGYQEMATGSSRIADPQLNECRQPPLAPGDSMITLLYARSSQDCGSSTASKVEKSRLLRVAKKSTDATIC